MIVTPNLAHNLPFLKLLRYKCLHPPPLEGVPVGATNCLATLLKLYNAKRVTKALRGLEGLRYHHLNRHGWLKGSSKNHWQCQWRVEFQLCDREDPWAWILLGTGTDLIESDARGHKSPTVVRQSTAQRYLPAIVQTMGQQRWISIVQLEIHCVLHFSALVHLHQKTCFVKLFLAPVEMDHGRFTYMFDIWRCNTDDPVFSWH